MHLYSQQFASLRWNLLLIYHHGQIKCDESDVNWSLLSRGWVWNKVEVKYEKPALCLSGFVYYYSNHFTAPRHVNLIDVLTFLPNPRTHLLQVDSSTCKKKNNTLQQTTFPFPPRLCGLAPPQGTSHIWIHSVIYNWLLCVLSVALDQLRVNEPCQRPLFHSWLHPLVSLPYNWSKLTKSHSSERAIIQAPEFTHSFKNQHGRSLPVLSFIDYSWLLLRTFLLEKTEIRRRIEILRKIRSKRWNQS